MTRADEPVASSVESGHPCGAAQDERGGLFFELAPESIFVAEGDEWRVVEANRACRELFLFDGDAPLPAGLPLAELFANGQAGLQELLDGVQGKDFVGSYVVELRDRAGLTFPATLSVRRLTGGDGPRLLVSVQDVTELKRAEARTRFFWAMAESAIDAIVAWSAGEVIVYANPSSHELLGVGASGLLGRPVGDLVEDGAAAGTLLRQTADRGNWQGELRLRRGTGEGFDAYVSTWRQADGADGLPVTVCFVRDITEMKRMHAEVERYSRDLEGLVAERTHEVHLLSRIITSTMTSWVISDLSGRLVRWNRAFEDLVGYGLEELVGFRWSDLTPPEQHEVEQATVEASHGGAGYQVIEQDIRRGDGALLPVEVRLNALDVGESEPVVFRIVTDIASHKETERRLIEARHNAEEASRLKSEFLASISHELRTPLNSILGLANTLVGLREQGRDSKTDDFLARIIKSSRHLQGLINEVLEISRIEAGRLALRLEPIAPAEVLGAAENQFLGAFAEHELTARFTVAEATPLVYADRTRLAQIVANLVSNAVKFTEGGGTVAVTAGPAGAGELVEFCVSDTGRGIPPDKLETIFGPFEQLDRSGTTLGVGLGLAICRQLVEAQGGRIWAESEPGAGTHFHFTLPAAAETAARRSDDGREPGIHQEPEAQ